MYVFSDKQIEEGRIEDLVEDFNKELLEYVRRQSGIIDPVLAEKIHHNKRLRLEPMGIRSAVEFVKSRKHPLFCEEDSDVRDKIDYIECEYGVDNNGQIVIEVMNLIQVKTSEPPTEVEKRKITEAHRRWVKSSVMDLNSYKREYKNGIPDNLAIETLLENAEEVGELFLDMCTDPKGFNPQVFINKLDLEKLSNKQKAWLLLEYGGKLKYLIINARKSKKLTTEEARAIMNAVQGLEKRVKKEMTKLKNFSKINKINSIITVGENEVEKEELWQNDENNPYIARAA